METGGKTRQLVPEEDDLPVGGAHSRAVTGAIFRDRRPAKLTMRPRERSAIITACVILFPVVWD
jgi:hypothetical protein